MGERTACRDSREEEDQNKPSRGRAKRLGRSKDDLSMSSASLSLKCCSICGSAQ
jgi:hypothetical protein